MISVFFKDSSASLAFLEETPATHFLYSNHNQKNHNLVAVKHIVTTDCFWVRVCLFIWTSVCCIDASSQHIKYWTADTVTQHKENDWLFQHIYCSVVRFVKRFFTEDTVLFSWAHTSLKLCKITKTKQHSFWFHFTCCTLSLSCSLSVSLSHTLILYSFCFWKMSNFYKAHQTPLCSSGELTKVCRFTIRGCHEEMSTLGVLIRSP